MKYIYPAIFEKNEDGMIGVTFPDIFGGVTCGENEEDAMSMAKDLLKLMLENAPAQCENPTSIEKTQENFPGKKIVLVEVEI